MHREKRKRKKGGRKDEDLSAKVKTRLLSGGDVQIFEGKNLCLDPRCPFFRGLERLERLESLIMKEGEKERERGGSRKSGDCLHELFFLTRSLYPLRGVFHGVKSVNLSLILFRG